MLSSFGILLRVAGELTSRNVFRDESNVPVHKVKVEILYAEFVERVLDGLTNVVVVELEQFGSDPNLLAGNTGEFDTLSDLVLVLVTPGTVDVTVTRFESVTDGITHFTFG
jgi:hypothetical protein